MAVRSKSPTKRDFTISAKKISIFDDGPWRAHIEERQQVYRNLSGQVKDEANEKIPMKKI